MVKSPLEGRYITEERGGGGEVSRGFGSKYALGFIKLISQCSPGTLYREG